MLIIIPATIVAIAFCLVATICILVISDKFALRKFGIFMGLHWRRCTNLNDSNVEEQKYVQKVYGIEALILSVLVFSGLMCCIFEQFIAAWSLWGIAIIVLITYELVLLKCKKFQNCKYEISDEKRMKDYWENLQKQNLSRQENIDKESVNDSHNEI